jgi:antirestriction protein ArdC
MAFFGHAKAAAESILRAFEDANNLPKPLTQIFIHRKDASHFSKWSWGNQLLVILRGFTDARGFQQWNAVGRFVRKGEKAFHILGPVKKKITDKETGEEKSIVVGFKGVAVFGYEQTDGEPLPISDPEIEKWLDSLPLVDVAKAWGLSVDVFNGETANFLGIYRRRSGIALGVKNLSTWCHELVHAADDRNGTMKELGQHWRSETVAELGGSVVLELLGCKHEADLGGCFGYIETYAEKEKITVVDACMKTLERTCKAVALILDTAQAIRPENEKTAATPEPAAPS